MIRQALKTILLIGIAAWVVSNSFRADFGIISVSEICGAGAPQAKPNPAPSLKAGEKYWIGTDYYFTYSFDKKPQIGTLIIKVQVFTKDGKKDTSFEINGSAGMPSMRGAHDTGDQPFQRNKKGDYLLPVNVVMPGDWEMNLNFIKDKKSIYTGSIRFNV
jgi:hypothetical protein